MLCLQIPEDDTNGKSQFQHTPNQYTLTAQILWIAFYHSKIKILTVNKSARV